MKLQSLILSCLLLILSLSTAHASVTLVGTRVIYSENAKSVSLNFRSPDHVPSIMEVWTSLEDNPASSSQNADGPFVATPQVFRIDPQKGHIVKLTYIGTNAPQDKESVFYLNFIQLPAIKKDEQNKNKLLITYRSTVKIFYRPTSLKSDPNDAVSKLKLDTSQLSSGSLKLINPTEYHVTINHIDFKNSNKNLLSISGNQIEMIAPFSEKKVSVKPTKISPTKTVVFVKAINDLGGISSAEINL